MAGKEGTAEKPVGASAYRRYGLGMAYGIGMRHSGKVTGCWVPGWAPKCGIVHAIFPSRRGLLPSVRSLIDFLGKEFSQSDIA